MIGSASRLDDRPAVGAGRSERAAILGACLAGGAVGDALGLPFEGLPARRVRRWVGDSLKHRLVFGRGMVSDDTEHAAMTLLSLKEAAGDSEAFDRTLARRLRWWFAGIPAGVGLGTARSILRLWLGFSPARSGVMSAGNGPMMRAPVIGCWFADEVPTRRRFVMASTRLTHRDARAEEAALAVAEAAAIATAEKAEAPVIVERLASLVSAPELTRGLELIREGLDAGWGVDELAGRVVRRPGKVSGFAPETLAVALHAWLRHRHDYRATIESVVRAGGDTDTVAFVAGSLAGIDGGIDAIPGEWLEGISDWPLDPAELVRLADGRGGRFPRFPVSLIRNGLFLSIVLCHAFRRMLPPY